MSARMFNRISKFVGKPGYRGNVATSGLVSTLNGGARLNKADRARIGFLFNKLLEQHSSEGDVVKRMDKALEGVLRISENSSKDIELYLISWFTELLRQHADMNDLVESIDFRLSAKELECIKDSNLFDCTWRLLVPMVISRDKKSDFLDDIYCFGCASGATVTALKSAFEISGLKLPHLNLFDSFQGLPAEQNGVATNPYWREGKFSISRDKIEKILSEVGLFTSEYSIYDGFFADVLKSELMNSGKLKPALYIDIDCDLYISAFQALDFMFHNNLATTGTYIGYDDWGDTTLWSEGESRAHLEISEKYGVRFRQCFSWGRAPVIRKLFRVL